MTKTYTPTRESYYQKNKKEIKAKRKIKYQENIIAERQSSLDSHYKNKERNNKRDLANYHKDPDKHNKRRQDNRLKQMEKK